MDHLEVRFETQDHHYSMVKSCSLSYQRLTNLINKLTFNQNLVSPLPHQSQMEELWLCMILEGIQLGRGCWKSKCWAHGRSDEAVQGGMDCYSFLAPTDHLETSKVICMPCTECYLFDIMVTCLYDVCHSISMLEKFNQSLQNLSFESCV
jgi:hypothetical protein